MRTRFRPLLDQEVSNPRLQTADDTDPRPIEAVVGSVSALPFGLSDGTSLRQDQHDRLWGRPEGIATPGRATGNFWAVSRGGRQAAP